MRFLGMLLSLFGEFVGSQMIRFVVSSSSSMRVFRKVVKFSWTIVRALWHGPPRECELWINYQLLGLAKTSNNDH
jgi:hypothetical protein